MEKKKICICSDSIQTVSGLGKTSLRLAKGFYENGYDVCYFVITGRDSDNNCYNAYTEDYHTCIKYLKIYNCQISVEANYTKFDDYIELEKPDIVLSLLDPWNLDQIYLSKARDTFYWIAYCLFETPEYPEYGLTPSYLIQSIRKSLFDPLRNADICIPVSKMGEKILKHYKTKFIDNIYLGIDIDNACKDESLTKEKVFGKNISNDSYIFMTVGKNFERKKIDKIIESFALFKNIVKKNNPEEYNKYKLYIHSNWNELSTGSDLISIGESYGIMDDIIFPSCFLENKQMSEEDLYKRYKVSDAYICLSAGEGFGYGCLEALMHNKPVIYLDYGTPREFCSEYGYPVKVESYYFARSINMRWAIASVKDAASVMNEIIHDDAKINSFTYVKNNFDWDDIILPKLFKVIEKCKLIEKPSYGIRRVM